MEDALEPLGEREHFFARSMLANLPPGNFMPPHVDGDGTEYRISEHPGGEVQPFA